MPLRSVNRDTADSMYRKLCEELGLRIKELQDEGYDVHVEFDNVFRKRYGRVGAISVFSGSKRIYSAAYDVAQPGEQISLVAKAREDDATVSCYYPVQHPLRPKKPAWARSKDLGLTLDGEPYSGRGAVAGSEELAHIWIHIISSALIRLYSE